MYGSTSDQGAGGGVIISHATETFPWIVWSTSHGCGAMSHNFLRNCIIILGATIPKSSTPYACIHGAWTLSADLSLALYGVPIQGCHTRDAPDDQRNLAKFTPWGSSWTLETGLFPMWQCRRHSWRGRTSTITYSPVYAAIAIRDSEVFFSGSGVSVCRPCSEGRKGSMNDHCVPLQYLRRYSSCATPHALEWYMNAITK